MALESFDIELNAFMSDEEVASAINKAAGKAKIIKLTPEMDTRQLQRLAQIVVGYFSEDVPIHFSADRGSLGKVFKLVENQAGKSASDISKNIVNNYVKSIQSAINSTYGKNGKNATFNNIIEEQLGIGRMTANKDNIEKVRNYLNKLKKEVSFNGKEFNIDLSGSDPVKFTKQAEALEVLRLARTKFGKDKTFAKVFSQDFEGIDEAFKKYEASGGIAKRMAELINPDSLNTVTDRFTSAIKSIERKFRDTLRGLFSGKFSFDDNGGLSKITDDIAGKIKELQKIRDELGGKAASSGIDYTNDKEIEKAERFLSILTEVSSILGKPTQSNAWGLGSSDVANITKFKTDLIESDEELEIVYNRMQLINAMKTFVPGADDAVRKAKEIRQSYDYLEKTMGELKGNNDWGLAAGDVKRVNALYYTIDGISGKISDFFAGTFDSLEQTLEGRVVNAFIELSNQEGIAAERAEELRGIIAQFVAEGGNIPQTLAKYFKYSALSDAKDIFEQNKDGIISAVNDEKNAIANFQNVVEQAFDSVARKTSETKAEMSSMGDGNKNVLLSGTEGAIQAQDQFQTELDETSSKAKQVAEDIKNAYGTTGTGVAIGTTVGAEKSELETLKSVIEEVKKAVDEKTVAFETEKSTVDSVVSSEIEKLTELKNFLFDKEFLKNIGNGEQLTTQLTGLTSTLQKQLPIIKEAITPIQKALADLSSGDIKVKLDVKGLDKLNITEETVNKISLLKTVVEHLKEINPDGDFVAKLTSIRDGLLVLKDIKEPLKGVDFSKLGLNKLKNVATAENISNLEDFVTVIELLTEAITKLNAIKPETLNLLSNIKFSKSNVDKMVDMSVALEMVNNSLAKFSAESMAALSAINELVSKLDGLKNLSQIIKSPTKAVNAVEAMKTAEENIKNKDNASEKSIEAMNSSIDSFANRLKTVGMLTDENKNKLEGWKSALSGVVSKSELENISNEFKEFSNTINIESEKIKQNKIRGYQTKVDSYKLAATDGTIPETTLAKYDQYVSQITDKMQELQKYTFGKLATDKDRDNIARIDQEISDIEKKLKGSEFKEIRESNRNNWILKAEKWLRENSGASEELKSQVGGIIETFNKADNQVDFGNAINEFRKLQAQAERSGQVGLSFLDDLKKRFRGLGLYLASFVSFYRVIGMFREGIQTIKEYNDGLKEMRKVTSDSLSTLKQFQKESFRLADSAGVTSTTIQQSTADWLRLGESLKEAGESAKQANILYNISEFESVDDATRGLTALSQAYKDIEKEDIVNRLVSVGDNFPIAVNGLTEGLEKSAAALKQSGADINEAMALIVGANSVIQDPSSAGGAMRTIALRIRGTKAGKEELEAAGEDVGGYIETVSKLRDTIKQATAVTSNGFKGVDILDDKGSYRDIYNILLDISEIYSEIEETDKKMGSNHGALLLETIAGKNRSNAAASLLQNPEMLKAAYEQALDSEGAAQKELEAQFDSIEGKITVFQNRVQEFWATFLNEEVIKNFISVGTDLISVLTGITKALDAIPGTSGGINAIALATGIFMTAKGGGFILYKQCANV